MHYHPNTYNVVGVLKVKVYEIKSPRDRRKNNIRKYYLLIIFKCLLTSRKYKNHIYYYDNYNNHSYR